jgi:hypothetical protein
MRVLISNEVFSDPDLHSEIEILLAHAVKNRCYLDAEYPNSSALEEWHASLDPKRQEDWRVVSSWSVLDSGLFPLRTWIAATDNDLNSKPVRFEIKEINSRVGRPMRIWLENDRNDRRFWLSMMSPEVRKMFIELEDRRIVQYDSRGGLGELRLALEDMYTRKQIDKHDSYIMFDSDASFPGDKSSDASRLIDLCSQIGLPHHCLDRRAIENYIPKAAFHAWLYVAGGPHQQKRLNAVNAYWRMSDAQRNHYRLKSGWDARPSTEVKVLFSNLASGDRDALASGIANDIANVYDTYHDNIYEWAVTDGIDQALQATIERLSNWVRVPYA